MDKDEARRILAAKRKRAADEAAGARAWYGQKPVEPSVSDTGPVIAGADQSIATPVATPTLADQVQTYMDEYLAALAEIERCRARLIAYRGSEDALTEDDQLTLENIADIVRARYERLLET